MNSPIPPEPTDSSPLDPPVVVPSRPPAAADWISPQAGLWLAFGLPLLLFVVTCCRTLYVGDAGDFAVASWTFGIAHPPGYPLYTLLGALFARLPMPGGETEVAWRMNLMSSFFGALTCGFVYLLLARVGQVRILALIAALGIAVSRAFWWQSTITEVYTLNTFFMALQWWLASRYIDTGARRWWHWLLLAMSLSLAHHQSILMFFPFIFGWIWWERRTLFPSPEPSTADAPTPRLSPTAEWVQAGILLILPVITLYLYLPLVDCKTPVTADRQMWNTPAEEFNYVVREIILRDVYKHKAQFQNPTTRQQVAEHYLKYLVGDPTRAHDAFESGDQGTLALGILLALWAAFLWRPRVPEDLPAELRSAIDLPRLQQLARLFLGCLALFVIVVLSVPSGDILNAPQTNLRVVMPPLLIPGHYYLLLSIFVGALAIWHHLPAYVWRMREQDPMPPANKLALSRQMLTIALGGLVLVNGYNNWPVGNRSGSYISWVYLQNVIASLEPDTFVLNTGDETFLYWYLDQVHWDLHPEERKENLQFSNWIHQIPSYEELAGKTEAELQRDIIGYFMKQQLVERAARRLGAASNKAHQVHLATTFFRPEFLQVPFFRHWQVTLDGLVYKWEPIPEYEPIAIQNVLQTQGQEAEWDRLDPSALQLLSEYLTVLLYEQSPRFAASMNLAAGQPADSDGAATLAPIEDIGPLSRQPDGTLRGPAPSPLGMDDPDLIAMADAEGRVVYQVPQPPVLDIILADRDWWSFYDWRGVLTVRKQETGVAIDPAGVAFDAQEEEILARFQDLFVQHALQYYRQSTDLDDAIQAMAQTGDEARSSPEFEALRDQHLEALLQADGWLTHAVKLPFIHNPELASTSWGLLGDVKLNLGQLDNAAAAYNYLVHKLPPQDFPMEAARARANLAVVRNAQRNRAEAQRLVTEALIIDPGNSLATQLQQSWQAEKSAPPAGVPGGSQFTIPGGSPATEPPVEPDKVPPAEGEETP